MSQVCNEDGMEFTLRTPDGFVGRIYTYGFYDRCFFRGNGGTVNVLRISGPQVKYLSMLMMIVLMFIIFL